MIRTGEKTVIAPTTDAVVTRQPPGKGQCSRYLSQLSQTAKSRARPAGMAAAGSQTCSRKADQPDLTLGTTPSSPRPGRRDSASNLASQRGPAQPKRTADGFRRTNGPVWTPFASHKSPTSVEHTAHLQLLLEIGETGFEPATARPPAAQQHCPIRPVASPASLPSPARDSWDA